MLTIVASVLTFKMIEKPIINLVFVYPVVAMFCDAWIVIEIIKLVN